MPGRSSSRAAADVPVQEFLDPAPEVETVLLERPAVAFFRIHHPFDIIVGALDRVAEGGAVVDRHAPVDAAVGQQQRLGDARCLLQG